MTGAEWLANVFEPALARGVSLSLLRAQVQALHECGVLDHTQAVAAEERLEANRLDIAPPATTAPPPSNRLLRVLAPSTPLADIDGVTFVLTCIELWEHSVDLFVAGLPSAVTSRREHRARDALEQWARRGRSGVDPGPPPSYLFRTAALGLLIDLADDVGTPYRLVQSNSGGSGAEWRVHRTCSPGVPLTASRLVVHVADDDGRPVQSHPIPLDGQQLDGRALGG